MLHLLKPYVERHPEVAATYRQIRSFWKSRQMRPRTTVHGFPLIGDDTMIDGRFEPDETRLITEHMARFEVFVDVGTNIGFFTCLVGVAGKHTVSIEPLADNLAVLYANLLNNKLSHAEVFPLGVAAAPGICKLYGEATGASLVEGWAGTSVHHGRVIPVTTLDTLLRGRFEGTGMFVKIDVEGGEFSVLEGAAETLARTPKPTWLVEVCLTENFPPGQTNPHFSEVFERFWSHGYEARTGDHERRVVTADDVARWVRNGRRDFGTYNFLFAAPG